MQRLLNLASIYMGWLGFICILGAFYSAANDNRADTAALLAGFTVATMVAWFAEYVRSTTATKVDSAATPAAAEVPRVPKVTKMALTYDEDGQVEIPPGIPVDEVVRMSIYNASRETVNRLLAQAFEAHKQPDADPEGYMVLIAHVDNGMWRPLVDHLTRDKVDWNAVCKEHAVPMMYMMLPRRRFRISLEEMYCDVSSDWAKLPLPCTPYAVVLAAAGGSFFILSEDEVCG